MIKKILYNLWHGKLQHVFTRLCLEKDMRRYKKYKVQTLLRIKKSKRIKIVFFPINIGMWKNDYLFEKFLADPRFDPYVISFFVPVDNIDYQRRNQDEMREYFTAKGYPYYDMYNFEKKEWFDIELFQPDVVFYTQAVNVSYRQYNIQSLWKRTIFYYIPYCLLMENETKSDNTLLFNICMKVFAPSDYHKQSWSEFANGAKNVVVTGYPSFDYLIPSQPVLCAKWKCNDKRKRVIWAPHHSIRNVDSLSYSNFLEVADAMVLLAEKYQSKIEFVFKPHPRLRPKLEQFDGWGIERTQKYYQKWSEMPNSNFVDGDYFDLFLSSDAMIHDCSTFMAEYLLTQKPVMFNLRDESGMNLNDYAKCCYKQHYIGRNIKDIEFFLNDVVLGGNDEMRDRRIDFVEKELRAGRNEMVAERIFKEIKKDLA